MGEAKKGIGQLLGPVVGKRAVLERDVIAVGQDALSLVRQPIDAAPEDVDRGAEMPLQAANEGAAMGVARRYRLVRDDAGEELALLRHARAAPAMVVLRRHQPAVPPRPADSP